MATSIKKGSALASILAVKSNVDDGQWVLAKMAKTYDRPRVDKREGTWIHASALDNPCDRCVGYVYAGVKVRERNSAQQMRTYEYGLQVERRILKEAKRAKMLIRAGHQHEDADLRIRYTIDGVIVHPEFGFKGILEIKTAQTANTWKKYQLAPNPDHVTRTNLYMALEGIHRAYILYEQMEWPHKQKIHPIDFDPVMWDDQKERIRRIVKCVDANECPPQREQIFGGCIESPYYELCVHEVRPHDAPKLIEGVTR